MKLASFKFQRKDLRYRTSVLFGRQMMKELVHFFDWNVARSLYSIADIQSCIDKNLYELEVNAAYGLGYCNWMIDCGGEKITIVSSSSTVQNKHPLSFDETGRKITWHSLLCSISSYIWGMDMYRETAKNKVGNNSNNSIIFTKSEYDCEEAMSVFEGLQIKPIYLPIDIRLTVNEKIFPQILYCRKSIKSTNICLWGIQCLKTYNELTEQIYGCRIDEFEEDKRNSSYKISLISPKATII
ncbi:unnamed protein product [Rhizophagus irregularis]|nr:unnamed protein product [Rhizophagus irregularis]